ncbi:MAG: hypothetical protein COW00_02895 [Bdellovibrio sp. CG12_big_fil_rev_8_21_14_0_65_39_13]|nr:MAG: hypothetical protein COW78_00800 [Bdellovibrio sp. CG22_combo_CG10-13_8_21_14_all_39_27]PIQ61793.1 MAG: hypothetical protein COW00_02895 [Bdellovibrio sp. CG12_big_fil_rev_8_21_14_0_65_39_13]PIR33656.1 MAG: hypothetical protein COV37_15560 [Bdellovibrio sp. CG11_big_fil_rev_8_21_14_0_20_39_38]
MKLVELRIKNFRGLGGDENKIRFDDSNIIFLIGQNNVGKSSILYAYEYFVSAKKKALVSDFFKHDQSNKIIIEGDFLKEESDEEDSVFKKEKDWVNKWVQDGSGYITIKKEWDSADKEGTKYTKDKSGEWVKNGFGGLETIFTKHAPSVVFIKAIETVESLEKSVNDIIDKEHIKKLEKDYKAEFDDAVTSIKKIQDKITSSDNIGEINTRVNEYFKCVFPKLELKISVKDEGGIDLAKAFKTNHSIDVKKDGVERKETFDQHGHGVIRQALFNFLAFVKNSSKSEKKEYMLLFEEPELFLHPKSEYLLREQLYEIAKDSPFQVVCATHSPKMIDISKTHSSLVRVIKEPDETTKTFQVGHNIFQNEDNKDFVQMVNRFNPYVCDSFYADNVLLLEGDTEAIVCRLILDKKYPDKDIHVLNTGSKNNIPFFQRILSHFNIEYVVIHDSDTRYVYNKAKDGLVLNKEGEKKNNSAWTLNNSIWKEIEKSRESGIKANRLVSVYDFETLNGYKVERELGKPLSAFKFVSSKLAAEEKLPIFDQIDEIVKNSFSKGWDQLEIDKIEEPTLKEEEE